MVWMAVCSHQLVVYNQLIQKNWPALSIKQHGGNSLIFLNLWISYQ
jgi:hypothetical protein